MKSQHTFSLPILRKHLGKFPGGSKAIARLTKISLRVVRAHRDGDMHVKDFHLIAYMRALGAPFINDVLHEVGYGGARKVATVCPRRVMAKMSKTVAVVADALQDNRIDHSERPLVDAALIEWGVTLANEGRIAA